MGMGRVSGIPSTLNSLEEGKDGGVWKWWIILFVHNVCKCLCLVNVIWRRREWNEWVGRLGLSETSFSISTWPSVPLRGGGALIWKMGWVEWGDRGCKACHTFRVTLLISYSARNSDQNSLLQISVCITLMHHRSSSLSRLSYPHSPPASPSQSQPYGTRTPQPPRNPLNQREGCQQSQNLGRWEIYICTNQREKVSGDSGLFQSEE
jgi:hypothetical protein